jgi:hypothetical protein
MIGLPKPTPAKKRRAGGHIFIAVCVIVLAIAFVIFIPVQSPDVWFLLSDAATLVNYY